MKREYYTTPKASRIMRIFWKAAGGDRYLLERATYSDQIKYMCLGGIVVATGVMAALAGGYAFYTIFAPKSVDVLDKIKTVAPNPDYIPTDIPTMLLSMVFGFIWGLIIFNIDRFIVTSTGKGDGTEAITWDELKGAIPRIIMGAIIALTISKPVEIRMFKSEIDLAITKQQAKEKELGIQQAEIIYKEKVAETKTKLGKIQSDIDQKNNLILNLRTEVANEITGKNNNGAGEGKRAIALQTQIAALEEQVKQLENTPEYLSSLQDIRKFEIEKNDAMAFAERKAATLDGLLIRIQKAHEIAGWVISLFITLLFMAIELTPVFFKLMLIKTPYDYMEENIKELIKAENGIEVKYNVHEDKQGLERHSVYNHEVDKLLHEKIESLKTQKHLISYALSLYENAEKEKIANNPQEYINTN